MPRLWPILITFFLGWSPTLQAEWNLMNATAAHPEYKGPVPNKSDVIFSTRFKRPEAVEISKAFKATRIEWVYSTDREFVRSLQTVAPWFGGAVSSTITLPSEEGLALDIEGKPVVAPWMKSWGAKWITTTSPAARDALISLAKQYLELGAKSIQVDDPLLQFAARGWGGDFSESSLQGFRDFLKNHPDKKNIQALGLDAPGFDYRKHLAERYGIRTNSEYLEKQRTLPESPYWNAYLKQSVLSHFVEFRKILDASAGKRVPLSMNLSLFGPDAKRDQFALVQFADYAMVETKINDFDILTLQAATYRSLGMGYAPSILPLSRQENRAAISYLYALGGQPIVPWDTFVNQGPDEKPTRFFGTPTDYADIYQFVRANADIFDGHELVPVVGILSPTARYQLKETLELVRRLNRANLSFVIIPVGEGYTLSRDRLGRLKMLVTVNASTDLHDEDRATIEASGVELLSADSLDDTRLRTLSPVRLSPSGPEAQAVIRASTSKEPQLAIHILQKGVSAESPNTGECRNRIAIKLADLTGWTVSDANFRSTTGNSPVQLKRDGDMLRTDTPCKLWGVLVMHLRRM
jgi:hypothetical protein